MKGFEGEPTESDGILGGRGFGEDLRDCGGLGRFGVKFPGSLLRGDGGLAVALILALLLMEAEREPALLLGIQQTGEFRCTALA